MPDEVKKVNKASIQTSIAQFFEDVTTLDVLTLTGNISLVGDDGAMINDDGVFSWDDMFKNIAAKLKAKDVNVSVVAYTHAEWDLDSVNFVTNSDEATQPLIEAHNAAVKAAQQSRFEAVKSLGNLIGLKI